MAHKHRVGREDFTRDLSLLNRFANQRIHLSGNVVRGQPRPMESRVGHSARQQTAQRNHAAPRTFRFRFDDQACCTHSEDHAMPSGIKRQSSLFYYRCGGRRSCGQKAGSDPLHKGFVRHVIRTHNNDAFTALQPYPVRRHGHRLGRTRTRCIGLCVGALSTDVLSKLRMSHTENLEQEATVKVSFSIVPVGSDMFGELVQPREGRGKNNACVCSHFLGQLPACRNLLAFSGGVVGLNQRNLSIFERFYSRSKGELRCDIKSANPIGIDTILLCQVELRLYASKSNDFFSLGDLLERALTGFCILMQANDVLR